MEQGSTGVQRSPISTEHNDDPGQRQPSPLPAVSSEAAHPPGAIHVHVHTTTKWREPLTLATLSLAVGTLFLVAATMFLVKQTHRDAEEAIEIARKTNDKIIDAERRTNVDSIEAQRKINQELVQSQRQSTAQSIRAGAAQSEQVLRLTATLAWLDQRPWISVYKWEFPELEENKAFQIRLLLQNTGKTAALNQVTQTEVSLSDTDPPPTDFGKTPEVGPFNIPAASNTAWIVTDRWTPPADNIAAYRDNRQRLYVHTLTRYSDLFNNIHLTQTCVFHRFGTPADQIVWCPGNTMN